MSPKDEIAQLRNEMQILTGTLQRIAAIAEQACRRAILVAEAVKSDDFEICPVDGCFKYKTQGCCKVMTGELKPNEGE